MQEPIPSHNHKSAGALENTPFFHVWLNVFNCKLRLWDWPAGHLSGWQAFDPLEKCTCLPAKRPPDDTPRKTSMFAQSQHATISGPMQQDKMNSPGRVPRARPIKAGVKQITIPSPRCRAMQFSRHSMWLIPIEFCWHTALAFVHKNATASCHVGKPQQDN